MKENLRNTKNQVRNQVYSVKDIYIYMMLKTMIM